MLIRWIVGFVKALLGYWTKFEWAYYAKAGLDPRMPAFQRWEIVTKAENKRPETEAERVMPVKNHTVILRDKFMLTRDEILFFHTDKDKVDALLDEYKKEMQSMSAGDFYHNMVRHRNLDFLHNIKIGETISEGREIDPEQEREKFLR